MSQAEMLPRAEMVAAVVSGRAVAGEKSQNVQVVAKLPIYNIAKLDAWARRSGKNRTEMLSMLLSVGLEEVERHVDDAVAEELVEIEAQCLAELLGEG